MISCDGFFDLETQDWTTFVMGGLALAGSDECELFSAIDAPDMEWALYHRLLQVGGCVWSWNGGRFDMQWLAECARIDGKQCRLTMSGSRITRLQVVGVGTEFRDAVALIPMSLLKACGLLEQYEIRAIFDADKPHKDTGLPCVCGDDCGGYCSIRLDMAPHLADRLADYLRRDCLAGLAIMEALIAEADRCDYRLAGTVGGSAWKTASAHGVPPAEWKRTSDYHRARRGYFGGRTQVFRPFASRGHRADIHSAYPAALAVTALPTGRYWSLVTSDARKAYANGKEGIFQARVSIDRDMFAPPLPVRLHDGRLAYPVGETGGHWTGLELRHAEACGVDVTIDGGMTWEMAEPVMAPFMRKGWQHRIERAGAWPKWHKWFVNSATGKLGENPRKDRVILNPPKSAWKACDGAAKCGARTSADCINTGPCCAHRCNRKYCRSWRQLSPDGSLWAVPFYRLAAGSHVQWCAYLTSAARVQVHTALMMAGTDAVYCDTDSLYSLTLPRGLDIGPELGQWGYDGRFFYFQAVAPKTYKYWDPATQEWTIRAKGLSGIDVLGWDSWRDGEPYEIDRGIDGIKSAARAGGSFFKRRLLKRQNRSNGVIFGDRILVDGVTYPRTIQEILHGD